MQQIAGHDHRVFRQGLPARRDAGGARALHRYRRLAPGILAQIGQPFAIPPDNVLRGGHARRDHLFRQAFGDQRMRHAHDAVVHVHVFGCAGFQIAQRHAFMAFQLGGRRAQGGQQLAMLARRKPVGQRERRVDVDGDALGVALGDQLRHPAPLLGLRFRIPSRREDIANRIARHGQPLDALFRSAIEEDQHHGAPRRSPGGRQHRLHHRVFIILAGNEDPHVHAHFAHDLGHDLIEPRLYQPVVRRHTVAQTWHARPLIILCGGCRGGHAGGQQQCSEDRLHFRLPVWRRL